MPALSLEEKFNIFAKGRGRVHRFGTEVLAEIFMGNASNTGGSWTGDLLIPGTEDFKTMPPI